MVKDGYFAKAIHNSLLFSILNRLKLWRSCWIEKLQDHAKKKKRYNPEEPFLRTQIWIFFYIINKNNMYVMLN